MDQWAVCLVNGVVSVNSYWTSRATSHGPSSIRTPEKFWNNNTVKTILIFNISHYIDCTSGNFKFVHIQEDIYIYTLIKVYIFHTKKCGRESFAFVSSFFFPPLIRSWETKWRARDISQILAHQLRTLIEIFPWAMVNRELRYQSCTLVNSNNYRLGRHLFEAFLLTSPLAAKAAQRRRQPRPRGSFRQSR